MTVLEQLTASRSEVLLAMLDTPQVADHQQADPGDPFRNWANTAPWNNWGDWLNWNAWLNTTGAAAPEQP